MISMNPPGANPPGQSHGGVPPDRDGESGMYAAGNGDRFRRIFDAAPFALVYADGDGELRVTNQAFRDLFGLTDADCRGLSYRDVTYPDDLEVSGRLIGELLEGSTQSVKFENRYVHSSGAVFWAQASVYLLHDETGKPTGCVSMLTDVSERKRLEMERIRQAEDLRWSKSIAEDQAARLERAVKDLEAARSDAETAAEQQSEFLAVMSHEIRTPMNGVIGTTDLLLQTELQEDQRELVETIRTSGESLLAIINDILDFSKIEAGGIEFESEPFEIRSCIEATMSLVVPSAAMKGLNVAYLFDPGVPDIITGDIMRLRQILVNLMSNAVKFTEKGEVVLSVDMLRNDGRNHVRFAIRDTGIGIAKDRMNKLFKSFSQIEASTARKYGGTGLGLAISKRLTELFGGKMWAESTPGKGSTFYCTITAEGPKNAPRPDLLAAKGRRILIVESHDATRQMLAQLLTPYEVDVTATGSGSEAVDLIRGADFDLAFVEADLPAFNGQTLAQLITQLPRLGRLPIVFLHMLGHQVRLPGITPAGTMAKPVKIKTLHDTLVRTLDRNNDSKPSAAPLADDEPTMLEMPGLRVLLAEDNPVNQKVAIRMLGKLGYEADIAGNGVEALAKLEARPYDIVLMDIMMPEMDGIETTRQIIRRYSGCRRPRIIALTANAMRGDRERCLDAGMDDYLAKPLRVDLLKEALAACAPVDESAGVPDEEDSAAVGEGVGGDGSDVAIDPGVPSVDLLILKELEEMMGDNEPNFLANIIDEYIADANALMKSIRTAAESESGPELQHAAHTLKSSSAMFGASAMASTCKDLEQIGAENRLDDAMPYVKLLERQYEAVMMELRTHVKPA